MNPVDYLFKIVAVIFIVGAALLGYQALSGSQAFQEACDDECAPSRAITPVVGGADACLCDEGHGLWRHIKVFNGKD